MNARFKRISLWLLGWGFIVLGILGLVLPVLQGILFLLIGLSILSNQSPWAARLLRRISERFPGISGKLTEARAKAVDLRIKYLSKKPKPDEFD